MISAAPSRPPEAPAYPGSFHGSDGNKHGLQQCVISLFLLLIEQVVRIYCILFKGACLIVDHSYHTTCGINPVGSSSYPDHDVFRSGWDTLCTGEVILQVQQCKVLYVSAIF